MTSRGARREGMAPTCIRCCRPGPPQPRPGLADRLCVFRGSGLCGEASTCGGLSVPLQAGPCARVWNGGGLGGHWPRAGRANRESGCYCGESLLAAREGGAELMVGERRAAGLVQGPVGPEYAGPGRRAPWPSLRSVARPRCERVGVCA